MVTAIILLAAVAGAPDQEFACRAMAVPRRAGDIIRERDTVAVVCDRGAAGRLRYDAHRGELRARADLVVGDGLGRVWFPKSPAVAAGDRVRIAARIGHVTLSREATALQLAHVGQSYFVRGDDGQIFVAPPASAADE